MTRKLLTTFGICVALIGLGLLYLSCTVSSIDGASVAVLLAQDRMAPETLAQFHFTPWRAPTGEIQPFISEERSFDNCKILRYRCGTRSHWLVHYTYYEAEYERRDYSKVVGPAVGPRSYTTPNFLTFVPLTLAGVLMFAAGLILQASRGGSVSEPLVLGAAHEA
jgi:hypothetical protein